MDANATDGSGIDRRTYLAALSAAGAAGLAGCGSDGDSGEDTDGGTDDGGDGEAELGERVPTIPTEVFQTAQTAAMEQTMNHLARMSEEHLGVPMEVSIKEITTFWDEVYNDERNHNFHASLWPPFMQYLDPANVLNPFHIKNAGANGRGNESNYANCEFSRALEDQAVAANESERQEAVNEALEISSQDVAPISLVTNVSEGAYRPDQLNAQQMGAAGVNARNGEFLWYSEPTNDSNMLVSNMTPANISNASYMGAAPAAPWNVTVYAPLFYYDRNYERQPHLATGVEITNNQRTFTFSLREDATFHDGEPITAEDVKWTYEFMNENPGEFPPVPEQPYDSIEVVDDKTVEITFPDPNASFLNAFVPIWGILPKHVWQPAGAEENPTNPDIDQIVGSGPYQVKQFTQNQILALTPYEDHWIDAVGDVTFRGFEDRQAAFRGFQEGSLNVLINLSGNTVQQIQDNMSETAEVVFAESFVSWEIRSQHSFAPSMFREFRHAVSQVVNRENVAQFFSNGEGEPELYSSYIGSTHPWRPDNDEEILTKIADSTTSNPEKAKQILEDAGWGWDDEGRLHYPPDKDLTPAWPEGSAPCDVPEEFPCLPELCPE